MDYELLVSVVSLGSIFEGTLLLTLVQSLQPQIMSSQPTPNVTPLEIRVLMAGLVKGN